MISDCEKSNFEKNQEKRKCYKAKEGHQWNPLLSYPRNAPCFCKSNIKFKKCCADKIVPTLTTKQAEEVKTYLHLHGY